LLPDQENIGSGTGIGTFIPVRVHNILSEGLNNEIEVRTDLASLHFFLEFASS
jgi:hypothetical protein